MQDRIDSLDEQLGSAEDKLKFVMTRNWKLFEEKEEISDTLKKTVNNALKLDLQVEELSKVNKRLENNIQEIRKGNILKVSTLNATIGNFEKNNFTQF